MLPVYTFSGKDPHLTASHSEGDWRRSSRCDSANCLEVATSTAGVAVRDSKQTDGPILRFSRDAWSAFIVRINEGDLR
jgi:Domain of unknown function (DUF397)